MSLSCDVFSFGMILFEIHSCELPYADVSPMMINAQIATGQVGVCVCVFVALIKSNHHCTCMLCHHTQGTVTVLQWFMGVRNRNAFGLQ